MRHSALHGLGRGPLAVWLLAAANACAQDADLTTLPLEQLMSMEVYSASRFNQKTSQAPSNVTVLTSADIRAYGWRTLADALRSIRGVYTSNDRSYSYVGARGFLRPGDLNARFLLQINGTRINDPVFDQALLGGEFPLDLELVDRIEYVPGPGSSVYGANAFFGVINVITRRAQDIEGTRATLEAGQGRARRQRELRLAQRRCGAGARREPHTERWTRPLLPRTRRQRHRSGLGAREPLLRARPVGALVAHAVER